MADPPPDKKRPRPGSSSRRGRPLGRSGGTREFLLDTARQVMVERGLGRATMREIAERAGVNPALLHYYFGTKSGLFTAIVESVQQRLERQLEEIAARPGSHGDRLRELLRAYTGVIAAEPYIARLMLEELLESDRRERFTHGIGEILTRHLQNLLDEGTEAGAFREPDLPFPFREIVAQVVFFLLMAPLSSGGPDAVARLLPWADEAAALLLHGLAKPAGEP